MIVPKFTVRTPDIPIPHDESSSVVCVTSCAAYWFPCENSDPAYRIDASCIDTVGFTHAGVQVKLVERAHADKSSTVSIVPIERPVEIEASIKALFKAIAACISAHESRVYAAAEEEEDASGDVRAVSFPIVDSTGALLATVTGQDFQTAEGTLLS